MTIRKKTRKAIRRLEKCIRLYLGVQQEVKENSMKALRQTHGDVPPSLCHSFFARQMAVLKLRLTRSPFPVAHFPTFPLRLFCHKGIEEGICISAYIQVTEQTLMIASKTKEDLIPFNLRVCGIHTSITYPNMRTIVALVRVGEGIVDIADVSVLIMGDPCPHEALEQSS